MTSFVRTFAVAAVAATGLTALAGCASNPPDTTEAPRAVVAEPTTGSNIPRRDRKGGVSSVTTMSGDQAKEAFNKPQVPATTN